MEGEADSNRILDNLVIDPCVSNALENSFFADLHAKCESVPWPHNANASVQAMAARMRSKEVVCLSIIEREHYQCSGSDIAAGEFQTLLRVLTPRSYPSLLESEAQRIILESVPGHAQFFIDAAIEDVIAVVEDALGKNTAFGQSGGRDGIAWVTDLEAVFPDLPSPAELVRRLGLSHLDGVNTVLVCEYARNFIPEIKVPRGLDAIDYPPFSTVTNCGAPHGVTHALDGAPDGLPEAVHRNCQLPPNAAIVRLHG